MSTTTDQLILDQQPYLKALARNIAKTLPHHVDYDELVAFGQDRKRAGSRREVLARDRDGIGRRRDRAFRRACELDLGDDVRADGRRASKGSREIRGLAGHGVWCFRCRPGVRCVQRGRWSWWSRWARTVGHSAATML